MGTSSSISSQWHHRLVCLLHFQPLTPSQFFRQIQRSAHFIIFLFHDSVLLSLRSLVGFIFLSRPRPLVLVSWSRHPPLAYWKLICSIPQRTVRRAWNSSGVYHSALNQNIVTFSRGFYFTSVACMSDSLGENFNSIISASQLFPAHAF